MTNKKAILSKVYQSFSLVDFSDTLVRTLLYKLVYPNGINEQIDNIDSVAEQKPPEQSPIVDNRAAQAVALDSHTAEFLAEANECLDSAEQMLLALEKQPQNIALIQSLCRSFHTIKGMAGFLALEKLVLIAHQLENFLAHCKYFQTFHFDLIFEAVDTMRRLIPASVRGEQAAFNAEIESLLKMLQQAEAPDQLVVTQKYTLEEARAKITEVRNRQQDAIQQILEQEQTNPDIKVKIAKVDNLIDWIGELVTIQAMIYRDVTQITDIALQNKSHLPSHQSLATNAKQLQKISRELQELAMTIRMVPLRNTMQQMKRLARNVAKQLDKSVTVQCVGEDTELDRNIVEKILPALLHLVRNAIDHGIESPQERIAKNKTEHGNLKISAIHHNNQVLIQIQDDGQGLDRKTIIEKAQKAEYIDIEAELTDRDIFQLIFIPGFSTAKQVTNISGRGVGLDVVKQNVDKLNGSIDVEAVSGGGTVFKIKLPLTTGIIEATIVRVENQQYILPSSSISEFVCIADESIVSIANKKKFLHIRNRTIPIFSLANLLYNKEAKTIDNFITEERAIGIVIYYDGNPYCIKIDEIIGQQQVVIKNLGKKLHNLQGISGGAILADGRVGLILDLMGIIENAIALL